MLFIKTLLAKHFDFRMLARQVMLSQLCQYLTLKPKDKRDPPYKQNLNYLFRVTEFSVIKLSNTKYSNTNVRNIPRLNQRQLKASMLK